MPLTQMNTINYHTDKHSPRNVLDPGLRSSFYGGNQFQKNQNMIMLGAQETETEEDQEAQRNRNINLADLQSLLA